MDWLYAVDLGLFRFINQSLSNPLFDPVMRWFSVTDLLLPLVVVAVGLLIWLWRLKGLFCAIMVALAIGFGDGILSKHLKQAIGRERPWVSHPETILRGGQGNPNASLPSAHTVNWFAATMVLFLFNRRSLRIMLPLAVTVGFSRIYNGMHYPSDVLTGALLGAGSAAALVILLNGAWGWAGRKWLPIWWQRMPSLLNPKAQIQNLESVTAPSDSHWLRAGYLLIVILTVFHWFYLAGGTIELSEDEAYQWTWSKHLALSYYSKPPLIAYAQFLGTSLWGDTAFGVRFCSPLLAAILGIALIRFFAREVNARVGFFLLLVLNTTPFVALGSILMTVDPLSVFFWTAAMLAGWRAIQSESRTSDWLWVGLWMGFGFLSKYTALFQWLCWAVFFALWPPARKQLRRPGPYLALLVNVLCMTPVIIWNAQHGWASAEHVAMGNAKLGKAWHFTLKYLGDFLGSEFCLWNPVFFVGIVIAAVACLRRRNHPLLTYFFSMGAPLFLVYLGWTFHSRVQANWIAPAIVPLLCLMVVYWNERWREVGRVAKRWLAAGLGLGLVTVVLMHDTDLVEKSIGQALTPKKDPLRRVRAWSNLAKVVGAARGKLAAEGKPTFIIAGHYGITGLISFYLPEAKKHVKDNPLVYFISSDKPDNQFYFWPGYASSRQGQNAIYVIETAQPQAAPERLLREFETVTSLGLRTNLYQGRDFHTIQLFECRNLR